MGARGRNKAVALGIFFSLFLVLVSPIIVSAATNTASTTISATVNSVISISSSSSVAISLTPTPGGVVSSASDTVTVNTNNTLGYNLTLSNADATSNLTSGSNTITAISGTQASPTALTAGKWGYRVVNVGGFGSTAYSAESNNTSSTSTWAGVPPSGSGNTIKNTSSIASNDTTTVWYGVKVTSSQPGGIYSDTVTYTATTN